MMNRNSIWSLTLLVAVAAVIGAGTTAYAFASTVDIPDPVLEKDPPSTNASERVQMTIRPGDDLPANGTVTMSMEGTNDIDFKGNPPAGITVTVTNETVTVTGEGGAAASTPTPPAPAPAPAVPQEPEPSSDESSEEEEE